MMSSNYSNSSSKYSQNLQHIQVEELLEFLHEAGMDDGEVNSQYSWVAGKSTEGKTGMEEYHPIDSNTEIPGPSSSPFFPSPPRPSSIPNHPSPPFTISPSSSSSSSFVQVLPSSRSEFVQKSPLLGLGQPHRAQPYPPFGMTKQKSSSLKPSHQPMHQDEPEIGIPGRSLVPFEENAFNIFHEHPPAVALPASSSMNSLEPLNSVSFHQTLEHPASKQKYSVTTADLCSFLQKKGKLIENSMVPTQKTSDEINELIRKFCSAKDLTFMTQSEASDIIRSDFKVEKVPLKGKRENGQFSCMVCPILQNHGRGFERKEDLKRHYQLHFKFARFHCRHCSYGNSRTDHMKMHIRKCHAGQDEKDYIKT
ncbi:Oidioi.mRNA.OKI2018_I69.XSR.g16390.t2.cds [Oikopleura dioica]|uniref:Oidioi.mRNA.OKI2018_I69.XSR.g16390.t2.cds n=1 Tax=Oikopleura dioica TaxID=34765 RepID=A0ABN7SHT9_OIKDI|nr:Oidioi.mRNA.OKI2018_I69.XSR.g16390.t2.cds [Oikopleura dioica]